MKTNIDLINRTGFFKSNGAGSFVTFPENEYICFIDELTWFMDKEEVILGSSINNNGFKFISINKKQDSLSFNALSASYNLKDYLINADGVKDIKVADKKYSLPLLSTKLSGSSPFGKNKKEICFSGCKNFKEFSAALNAAL